MRLRAQKMSSRTMRLILNIANHGRWLFAIMMVDYALCATVYGRIEHKGPIEATWWAIVTGFTVGYGDQYPTTTAGRGVGAFLIVSMWLLSLIAGAYITARVVIDTNEWSHDEQERHERSNLRSEQAQGNLPLCMTELPKLKWRSTDHNPSCSCGWQPPAWMITAERYIPEAEGINA